MLTLYSLNYRVRFALCILFLIAFVVLPAIACTGGDALGIADCVNNPASCQ